MSTPQPGPPPPSYEKGYYAPSGMPALPAINGEFVVFVFVWAVIGIIALASDQIGASEFITATIPLAVAYLLSRGIAKLGKVIEGR
ncbi:MAG TPA: hypothetical protein VH306_05830 [Gaiellaceae bacterium]|jgi:hypothetical protein